MLVLAVAAAMDRAGMFGHPGDDWRTFDQRKYVVTRAIDGDTVRIRPVDGGEETRVRLLGIDAPETARDGNPANHWAEQSRDYMIARAEGKTVIVRLEPIGVRDRYGRLLAYLFLSENDNLNLALVRDGQAYADRRFDHSLRSQFELAESEARKKGRGLWAEVTFEQQPRWRQAWLRENRSYRDP